MIFEKSALSTPLSIRITGEKHFYENLKRETVTENKKTGNIETKISE